MLASVLVVLFVATVTADRKDEDVASLVHEVRELKADVASLRLALERYAVVMQQPPSPAPVPEADHSKVQELLDRVYNAKNVSAVNLAFTIILLALTIAILALVGHVRKILVNPRSPPPTSI